MTSEASSWRRTKSWRDACKWKSPGVAGDSAVNFPSSFAMIGTFMPIYSCALMLVHCTVALLSA